MRQHHLVSLLFYRLEQHRGLLSFEMGGSGENSGLQAHMAIAPVLLLTFMCSGQQVLGNTNWYHFFGELIINQVFFMGYPI